MKRYRPVLNNRKEVIMAEDDSGDWTSLSCYYILHDRVVRAEGKVAALTADKEAETKATFDAIRTITQLRDENEHLKKAGSAMMVRLLLAYGGVADSTIEAWLAAKEGSDDK